MLLVLFCGYLCGYFGFLVENLGGQVGGPQDHLVRIVLGLVHLLLELLEGVLGDDARVAEPLAVGLDARLRARRVPALEGRRLDQLALAVAHRLEVLVHVEAVDGCLRAHVVAALAIHSICGTRTP